MTMTIVGYGRRQGWRSSRHGCSYFIIKDDQGTLRTWSVEAQQCFLHYKPALLPKVYAGGVHVDPDIATRIYRTLEHAMEDGL